jgi:LuxR family maltose regulon positive regulatory protein
VFESVVHGCGERVRTRLASGGPVPDPIDLARVLAEDLQQWPKDGWVVIDDYQAIARSIASDDFVARLVDEVPMHLLVAGRTRPKWASARKLLYGEVFEIGREQLCMDVDEARQVLEVAGNEPRIGLVALAAGWPAVIGMAAAIPTVDVPELLDGTLYEFFAEEVTQLLEPRTQALLQVLAIAPWVSPALLTALADPSDDPAIGEATRLGLLTPEEDGSYYVHPLLREFLTRKFAAADPSAAERTAQSVCGVLIVEQAWDAAFDVITRWRLKSPLAELLSLASDDLLNSGRLDTLREWLRRARELELHPRLVDVLEAECEFRAGDALLAERLAARSARAGKDVGLRQRALALAAQAAHFGDRPVAATTYAAEARQTASVPSATRRALYAHFLASIELEDAELAREILSDIDDLTESADDELRAATSHLHMAQRFGDLGDALTRSLALKSHVDRVRDPMIASAFLNGLAKALHINARYDESWELASRAYDEAERAALDFALPHILATRTHAAIGCHLVREARELLEALQVAAAGDAHLGGNMAILRAHLDLSSRDPRRARKALLAAPAAPDKGTQGEIHAYLALAMALDGEVGGAREFAERALAATETVETRVAVALVNATSAVGSPDQEAKLQYALELVERTGIRDPLVLAMRANPTLPKALRALGGPGHGIRLGVNELHRRWVQPFGARKERDLLTTREREILELVAEGLGNREIATQLYISQPTVKVHLRHVYEKLGVRNRAEAVARGVRID